MSEASFVNGSILTFTPLIINRGITFWDVPIWPPIPETEDDQYITITSEYVGRIDLIAYDFYGDVNLWWAIALPNNIEKMPTDVRLNKRIRVPAKSTIDALLRDRDAIAV